MILLGNICHKNNNTYIYTNLPDGPYLVRIITPSVNEILNIEVSNNYLIIPFTIYNATLVISDIEGNEIISRDISVTGNTLTDNNYSFFYGIVYPTVTYVYTNIPPGSYDAAIRAPNSNEPPLTKTIIAYGNPTNQLVINYPVTQGYNYVYLNGNGFSISQRVYFFYYNTVLFPSSGCTIYNVGGSGKGFTSIATNLPLGGPYIIQVDNTRLIASVKSNPDVGNLLWYSYYTPGIHRMSVLISQNPPVWISQNNVNIISNTVCEN